MPQEFSLTTAAVPKIAQHNLNNLYGRFTLDAYELHRCVPNRFRPTLLRMVLGMNKCTKVVIN